MTQTLPGNKPDYHLAMKPELSKEFYAKFVEMVKKAYQKDKIQEGIFGAKMSVQIVNDGYQFLHYTNLSPVTFSIDSQEGKTEGEPEPQVGSQGKLEEMN